MWPVVLAIVGFFVPCDHFTDNAYVLIRQDTQAHYALHVLDEAADLLPRLGCYPDWTRPGYVEPVEEPRPKETRSTIAATLYNKSRQLYEEVAKVRQFLDLAIAGDDFAENVFAYFESVMPTTHKVDKVIDLFAGELEEQNMAPETAHKWLADCRDICRGR